MADSSSSACLSKSITLSNRAAKANIHEELSILRQRCTSTYDLPYTPTQKITHFGEDEPVQRKNCCQGKFSYLKMHQINF